MTIPLEYLTIIAQLIGLVFIGLCTLIGFIVSVTYLAELMFAKTLTFRQFLSFMKYREDYFKWKLKSAQPGTLLEKVLD